jgi:hypothetical protein
MKDKVFGSLSFNIGWQKKERIAVYGKKYDVTLDVAAYFETDGITDAQRSSYKKYKNKAAALIKNVENKLKEYEPNAEKKYVPALMKIKRDGGLAIAFDDVNETEGGIVVCVLPKLELMSPDRYF